MNTNIRLISQILNYLIALVWLVNGLFCKILNLVPRHEQIVSRILGNSFAECFTKTIGLLEVLMAVWILSRFKPHLNAIAQAVIILTMNILEFKLVPDLLLWGKANLFFSMLFVALILINDFFVMNRLERFK